MRSTPNRRPKGKAPSTTPPKRSVKQLPTKSKSIKAPKKPASKPGDNIQFQTNILEARRREEEATEIELAKKLRFERLKELQKDQWQVFLAAIRRLPNRGSALEHAGLDRRELSDRLRTDPDFEKAFKQAFDDGLDSMEDEVVRRAVLGVDEPVYQGGLLVGHRTKYSDTLLMFFLEASRKKFRSGDMELRRPLSDEAKATMRQVFQEVADDAGTFEPPAAKPRKKRAQKGMANE